jgi:hypothetical protein
MIRFLIILILLPFAGLSVIFCLVFIVKVVNAVNHLPVPHHPPVVKHLQ